jgi:hypothetical protein
VVAGGNKPEQSSKQRPGEQAAAAAATVHEREEGMYDTVVPGGTGTGTLARKALLLIFQ